jgi:hypothetical protein
LRDLKQGGWGGLISQYRLTIAGIGNTHGYIKSYKKFGGRGGLIVNTASLAVIGNTALLAGIGNTHGFMDFNHLTRHNRQQDELWELLGLSIEKVL